MRSPGTIKTHSICVYCGSNAGFDAAYMDAAASIGRHIAESGRRLVYGGAAVGLMGNLARSALHSGGHVTGVLPRALAGRKELPMDGLAALHIVDTMHERKDLMMKLADAFVALPGGIGTLEEIFEVWCWAQLGFHQKPLGLLNVKGFYDPLLRFLDHQCDTGFMKPSMRAMMCVADRPATLLEALEKSEPPGESKWIG